MHHRTLSRQLGETFCQLCIETDVFDVIPADFNKPYLNLHLRLYLGPAKGRNRSQTYRSSDMRCLWYWSRCKRAKRWSAAREVRPTAALHGDNGLFDWMPHVLLVNRWLGGVAVFIDCSLLFRPFWPVPRLIQCSRMGRSSQ